MSSVWKRFQRINKKAAKFQFTASFHELSLHLTPRWKPHSLEVVWQRRNRRVATAVPAWEPGMREPLEGVCVWTLPANTVINVTLFRDQRTQRYEDKEWTFVLEDVSATGKRRQVATAQLNMTQYAGICQHDLRVTLRPLSKKLAAASLELTLSCLFLREGKATDEDMQSLASLMSMNAPNDIAPLDDFEDDEEDGPGSEAGSRVSTLRRKSRLPPYTGGPSPHGPSTLLQDGRCAEISDLAAKITFLTSSLQQPQDDDHDRRPGGCGSPGEEFGSAPPHCTVRSPSLTPTLTPTPPTHYSDAEGGADQEGDNATLEGDVVKESSAFSPDPRSPQFATSPPHLASSSHGITSPGAGNTSTPITTTTTSSSRPQDPVTSGSSEFPSAHSLSVRAASPDRTGASGPQQSSDSPSEAGRSSTRSATDRRGSCDDGADDGQ